MYLRPDSFVEELFKGKNVTDKDYILFALLIYARILRLLPIQNKLIQVDACKIFVELNDGIKRDIDNNYEQTNQIMQTLTSSFGQIPPLSVQMKNVSIIVGAIYTVDIDKYIYLAFTYAFRNINKKNRHQLFHAFLELSKIRLSQELTAVEAVLVPNKVVNNLAF